MTQELLQLLIQIKTVLAQHGLTYQSLINRLSQYISNPECSLIKHSDFEQIVRLSETDTVENVEMNKPLVGQIDRFLDEKQVKKIIASKKQKQKTKPYQTTIIQNIKKQLDPQTDLNFQLYAIDYDNQHKVYQPIKFNQNDSGYFIKDISDLILSTNKYHIKKIQSFSMIQKKINLGPRVMKPLIIPLLDGTQYAFIFETTEYRLNDNNYEESDRFYVFISNKFLPYSFIQMIKIIAKKYYDSRFNLGDTKYQLQFSKVKLSSRKDLLDDVDSYVRSTSICNFSQQNNIQQEEEYQLQWYLKPIANYKILIRLNSLHYYAVPILTLLFFYTMKQYKIVLVGSKGTRNMMSQLVFGIKSALRPIQYCQPIILMSITQAHQNFLDTPVPSLINLWGDNRGCERIMKHFKQNILSSQNGDNQMPSVLIDLNNMNVIQKVLSQKESSHLIRINQFTQKNLSDSCLKASSSSIKNTKIVDCLSQYLADELMTESQQADQFKKSFIYSVYDQKKNQLPKQLKLF